MTADLNKQKPLAKTLSAATQKLQSVAKAAVAVSITHAKSDSHLIVKTGTWGQRYNACL